MMQVKRRQFLMNVAGGLLAFISMPTWAKGDHLDVLLANHYQKDIDVTQYLISEKLDGVRAFWDGHQLLTRHGRVIHVPNWFTKGFPQQKLDGELWIGRGKFDEVSSTVRQISPDDAKWQQVTYQLFELPDAKGSFSARYNQLKAIVGQAKVMHLQVIQQFEVNDRAALNQTLAAVMANGGEGLMLHRKNALYVTGRQSALLKFKPSFDAEAKVVGYVAGRGKYTGKMGALLVETENGIRFKLGTGFSDAIRDNPPEIGSMVTYSYKSKTRNGKPRFASFLRLRHD